MTEFAIIGGGLAGLMLTRRLLEKSVDGADIALVDAGGHTRGSDVPAALMHPFPGRSVEPKPGQLTSAKSSVDLLRTLAEEMTSEAIIEMPMVRPLLGKLGDKLRESFHAARADYPSWLSARIASNDELREMDEPLARFDEALVYTPAFSVDTAKLRAHLRAQFDQAGVALVDDTGVERLERTDAGFELIGADGQQARSVVLAVGAGLKDWFPGLPMHGRGGESLVARPPDGAELGYIVNASGHVAPRADGVWVAGSTYWDPEDFDTRTDQRALEELLERCVRLTPALADSEPVQIWRGVRSMYRGDNRPLVGHVPDQDDLFVFGALGSKGLLRIPELADQLADRLLSRAEIDDRATTLRVKREKWTPADGRLEA